MEIFCLGLNHTTAPLNVRERVAFNAEEIAFSLKTLINHCNAKNEGLLNEFMILSTCNRTEFYCATSDAAALHTALTAAIAEVKAIHADEFQAHSYAYSGLDATRHLYRVVSGVDSMVLGETQIVGQYKKAVDLAHLNGTLGLHLNHLFQSAFSAAKVVRTTTAIGANSVSLAAAAVRLALRIFGSLTDRKILYIGAGEMIELCAQHISTQSPACITVANRSIDRGQSLAAQYNGAAIRLQELPDVISTFDVIVTCTASSLPIIGLGMMERAMQKRRDEPLCIIDLAVPRDVEEEVSHLSDVYVYTMDDLSAVVQIGKESREASVKEADKIIDSFVQEFLEWQKTREAVPAITLMRSRAEALRADALATAKKKLRAGENPDAVLEALSLALTKKLIHDPTVLLRDAAGLTDEEKEHAVKAIGDFYARHEP